MASSTRVTCLAFVGILAALLVAGGLWFLSGNRKSGAGGSSAVSASGARLTALYGLKPEHRLGFLILVQFPSPGATTRASSRWVGSATDQSGVSVEYQASLSDIEINGSTFDFDDGRVFFVQAKSGTLELHQLAAEIRDADHSDEVDRIAKLEEVEKLVR